MPASNFNQTPPFGRVRARVLTVDSPMSGSFRSGDFFGKLKATVYPETRFKLCGHLKQKSLALNQSQNTQAQTQPPSATGTQTEATRQPCDLACPSIP